MKKSLIALLLASAGATSLLHAGSTVTLWGVNESYGTTTAISGTGLDSNTGPRLLAFPDYEAPVGSVALDFGQLVWNDPNAVGTINIGDGNGTIYNAFPGGDETNAESMAIDALVGSPTYGTAWIVVNGLNGSTTTQPKLFSLDLKTVNAVGFGGNIGYTAMTFVANLNITSDGLGVGAKLDIEGLAYNEVSGLLYATVAEGTFLDGAESLWQITKAGATTYRGRITNGLALVNPAYEAVFQTDGLEFAYEDAAGNPVGTPILYAYDQADNEVYSIDYSAAGIGANVNNRIISTVYDASNTDGTDIETIAWDEDENQLVGFDEATQSIRILNFGSNTADLASTYVQQTLTDLPATQATYDIEGSGFFEYTYAPEPGSALLLALGAGMLGLRRNRKAA